MQWSRPCAIVSKVRYFTIAENGKMGRIFREVEKFAVEPCRLPQSTRTAARLSDSPPALARELRPSLCAGKVLRAGAKDQTDAPHVRLPRHSAAPRPVGEHTTDRGVVMRRPRHRQGVAAGSLRLHHGFSWGGGSHLPQHSAAPRPVSYILTAALSCATRHLGRGLRPSLCACIMDSAGMKIRHEHEWN
jgi:hypothetical protein